jgi:hypothetical protein
MTHEKLDWTHKNVKIRDIRKLNKLYVFKITDLSDTKIEDALFVKDNIFEERLKSYFLTDLNDINRGDILSLNWNMYITKGYYIKINEKGEVDQFNHDPEKWYISYLEIDGDLGKFSSVYSNKDINKDK